ncbi:uncharacterized protein LOC143515416 [Brachyhypopomus gauderio]|uniref:uncharacterized protein LOC143515416 n=1 Tax=Brachyhypopomus gauderio TaxID=698409 RepID=UPI004042B10C
MPGYATRAPKGKRRSRRHHGSSPVRRRESPVTEQTMQQHPMCAYLLCAARETEDEEMADGIRQSAVRIWRELHPPASLGRPPRAVDSSGSEDRRAPPLDFPEEESSGPFMVGVGAFALTPPEDEFGSEDSGEESEGEASCPSPTSAAPLTSDEERETSPTPSVCSDAYEHPEKAEGNVSPPPSVCSDSTVYYGEGENVSPPPSLHSETTVCYGERGSASPPPSVGSSSFVSEDESEESEGESLPSVCSLPTVYKGGGSGPDSPPRLESGESCGEEPMDHSRCETPARSMDWSVAEEVMPAMDTTPDTGTRGGWPGRGGASYGRFPERVEERQQAYRAASPYGTPGGGSRGPGRTVAARHAGRTASKRETGRAAPRAPTDSAATKRATSRAAPRASARRAAPKRASSRAAPRASTRSASPKRSASRAAPSASASRAAPGGERAEQARGVPPSAAPPVPGAFSSLQALPKAGSLAPMMNVCVPVFLSVPVFLPNPLFPFVPFVFSVPVCMFVTVPLFNVFSPVFPGRVF